ncbi:hypothetical protein [Vibrio taketomensis]|nr:hypothetical protein [Vibrio taketomensis]
MNMLGGKVVKSGDAVGVNLGGKVRSPQERHARAEMWLDKPVHVWYST